MILLSSVNYKAGEIYGEKIQLMKEKIHNIIDFSKILSLSVSGNELSAKEKNQLEKWLAVSEDNKFLLKELQKKKNASERSQIISHIDLNKEWAIFQKSISTEKKVVYLNWLSVLKYAAVIALPLLLGIYLFMQVDKQDSYVTGIPVEIPPGVKKAQLILSNGESIELDDNKLDLSKQEMNVRIENKNQSLNYTSLQRNTNKIRFNHLLIGKGEEYQVVLVDGTKVWLNSESKLTYPIQFGANIREVELEGEAYFEVSKNKNLPFIVKTKQMNIEVLGTSFNVSAYQDEQYMETTLAEGSVRISSNYGSSKARIIKPDEQVVFDVSTNEMLVKSVDAEVYGRWREGVFAFNEDALDEIMRKLSRWYDIKVFFKDNEVRSYQFSGKLPRFETCNELLEMIEKTTNVQFEIKNKQNVIVSMKK